MKKKILLGLLVVLLVGILTFAVFACDNKNPKDPTPRPTPPEPVEDDKTYDVTPALEDSIKAVDKTLKGINAIEDEASASATIFVDVTVDGKNYKVALDIAGSFDKGTADKNWAKIDADVLGVKVSLFAVNVDGKETLYVAQNILNKEVEWSKLSQFEEANVLSEKASTGVIDMVESLLKMDVTLEKDDDGNPKKVEKLDKLLNSGIVNQFVGGYISMIGLFDTLFIPGAGANDNFEVEGGYNIGLNVKAIGSILDQLSGVLTKLPADLRPIIEKVAGILLGGTLDLGEGTFTAGEDVPTIELGFGVNKGLFTGLSLTYANSSVKVSFGLDNVAISGTSSTAPAEAIKAVKGAEELAINLGLDIELDAIDGGKASVDLNVYPNVKMTFDNDGYVALDLSKLYAEVILTLEDVQYTVAQYNAVGDEDLYINLSNVASALEGDVTGGSDLIYKIPVNLGEKFNKMIADQKASKNNPEAEGEDEPEVSNAGEDEKEGNIVDEIMGLFTKGEDGKVDFVGAVMAIAGKLGAIKDAVVSLADFVDTDTEGQVTIKVEGLIKNLLAKDGLIGGMTSDVKFDLYKGNQDKEGKDVKDEMTLAELMAPEAILENVVALINTLVYEGYTKGVEEGQEALSYSEYFADHHAVTIEDAVALVANFTGATVVEDNFYKNMSITLAGYAQDGIGASIAATINDKSLKIGVHANIIENKTVYDDAFVKNYSEKILYVLDSEGKATDKLVSNNTSVDGGKLLLNTVKGIFNALVNREHFTLDTFRAGEKIRVQAIIPRQ